MTLRSMDRLSVQQCREQLFIALTNPAGVASLFDRQYPRSERLELDANLVLYMLMCAEPTPNSAVRTAYIQSLFDSRKEMRALGSCDGMFSHGRLRTVTSALLECSTAWEYKFTLEGEDTRTVISREQRSYLTHRHCHVLLLGVRHLDPRPRRACAVLDRTSLQ